MRHTFLFIAFISSIAACKWTEFDDLKDEAWVNATENPDNGSTNWGLAVAPSRLASASGGRVTVLGTAASIYNEIEFAANGSAKIAGTELELGDIGVANLELQPLLLSDPSGDDVALVTKRGPQEVVVLEGVDGTLVPHQVFGADTADAAAYMVAPGIDAGPTPQPSQPLVASADVLFGTFYTPPESPFMQVKCKFSDGGTAVPVRALGAVRFGTNTTDDVVVWGANGKLYVVSGQVFNGARSSGVCPDTDADNIGEFDAAIAGPGGTPVPQLDIGFIPNVGSQIITFAGGDADALRFAIIQGHDNTTKASHLQLVDLGDGIANPALVGNPATETGLVTAALWDDGATRAVLAGYPTAQVDGVASGKAVVYPLDLAAGISADPTEVLHDAQPDDGQSFGRTVAVIPFNGLPILVVGANNEVFTYFRTAELYNDDTREGR